MNNTRLSLAAVRRLNALDRFQTRVAMRCATTRRLLLDVGCGSGRFLVHQRERFERVVGVEVSAESRAFARDQLGLRVEESLPADLDGLSLVTFWHAAEHIAAPALADALVRIRTASSPDTRVLVCVPNGASTQYRLFGDRYAYYDVVQHPHQFTSQSLDRLMRQHGFTPERRFYSFPYSAFGYLQGMLNCVTSSHNYLYYRTKRGETFDLRPLHRVSLDATHASLALALGPLAATLALADCMTLARGGVLTTCYRSQR